MSGMRDKRQLKAKDGDEIASLPPVSGAMAVGIGLSQGPMITKIGSDGDTSVGDRHFFAV